MESNQLLTYVLFTPLIGAMLLLVFQREHEQEIRVFGFVISIITFILSLMIFAKFESLNPGFQFVHKIPWITNLYISYHVGVDGLSMLLLLLTTFITPLTLLSSWKSINKKVKEFTFFMLLLEVGMIGVFVSLDLFLFYVFWEAMLIPMYFIIGIWGGERRIYASVKFFLFTMFGSLLMLVAIIWLAVSAGGVIGHFTTDLVELYSVGPAVAKNFQNWMFLAFTLSFAIKIPLFPLHTWSPKLIPQPGPAWVRATSGSARSCWNAARSRSRISNARWNSSWSGAIKSVKSWWTWAPWPTVMSWPRSAINWTSPWWPWMARRPPLPKSKACRIASCASAAPSPSRWRITSSPSRWPIRWISRPSPRCAPSAACRFAPRSPPSRKSSTPSTGITAKVNSAPTPRATTSRPAPIWSTCATWRAKLPSSAWSTP